MAGPIRHNFPSGAQDQFNVRFPDGMRERIRIAADLNGRSMNAEIVATLEAKYPPATVDVHAVESVLHYVASATTTAMCQERLAEVNQKFMNIGSPLRAELSQDGRLSIITEF